MAAYSTGGALNVKLLASYSDFNKVKCVGVGTLQVNKYCQLETVRRISISCLRQEASHFGVSVQQSWRSANTFLVKCTSSQTQSQSAGVSEETKPAIERNMKISSSEVQSLLNDICNTTSIAEFKLNLGGFHLHVKRDLNVNDMTTLPSSPPPVHIDTSNQVPNSNGSAATTSLAVTKAIPSSSGIQKFLDAASDEGLIMLQSPKVGQFRRSRTIKGKRAPPPCKEKQEVKEGQVLCFIEQLGGEIPIESDVSGEVVKILKEDGEPVGYGDALIAILPSFPGIKKLQLPA